MPSSDEPNIFTRVQWDRATRQLQNRSARYISHALRAYTVNHHPAGYSRHTIDFINQRKVAAKESYIISYQSVVDELVNTFFCNLGASIREASGNLYLWIDHYKHNLTEEELETFNQSLGLLCNLEDELESFVVKEHTLIFAQVTHLPYCLFEGLYKRLQNIYYPLQEVGDWATGEEAGDPLTILNTVRSLVAPIRYFVDTYQENKTIILDYFLCEEEDRVEGNISKILYDSSLPWRQYYRYYNLDQEEQNDGKELHGSQLADTGTILQKLFKK
jgi:hypothetical protein